MNALDVIPLLRVLPREELVVVGAWLDAVRSIPATESSAARAPVTLAAAFCGEEFDDDLLAFPRLDGMPDQPSLLGE